MCLRFLPLWRQDPRLHGRLKEARAPWEIDVLRKLIGYILFSYPLDILLSPKSIDLPNPRQKSLDREVKTDHFLTYGGTSLQCGFCQFENVHLIFHEGEMYSRSVRIYQILAMHKH